MNPVLKYKRLFKKGADEERQSDQGSDVSEEQKTEHILGQNSEAEGDKDHQEVEKKKTILPRAPDPSMPNY